MVQPALQEQQQQKPATTSTTTAMAKPMKVYPKVQPAELAPAKKQSLKPAVQELMDPHAHQERQQHQKHVEMV